MSPDVPGRDSVMRALGLASLPAALALSAALALGATPRQAAASGEEAASGGDAAAVSDVVTEAAPASPDTATADATEPPPETSVSHTVSFDAAGGTSVAAQVVTEGEAATRPDDPTLDGFSFAGWTLDGEPYDFSAPVMHDVLLVAGWERDEPAEPTSEAEPADDAVEAEPPAEAEPTSDDATTEAVTPEPSYDVTGMPDLADWASDAAYRESMARKAARAGSETEWLLTVDCDLCRICVLHDSGGAWEFCRGWDCDVGRVEGGRSISVGWTCDTIVAKYPDAGAGVDVNPWMSSMSGGQSGMGIHGGWGTLADYEAAYGTPRWTPGGIVTDNAPAEWVWDTCPIGTRVVLFDAVDPKE